MDHRDLQLFLTLAETLHFGRTAELRHLSPSAVSRSLQRLESAAGQRLLERDRRSVRLTGAGRRFADYARRALADWEELQRALDPGHSPLAGELSLYCSVTAVYGVLAAVLEPFRARYPGIELKLHTGDQAQAIERVARGDEDLAIAARPGRMPRALAFHTLVHSPLVFIGPATPCAVAQLADTLFGSDAPGNSARWSDLPFILSEKGETRTRLERWFRHQRLKPNVYARVSGHEAIVSMVALGFGVGVVPELVLANSPLSREVRVLDVQPSLTPFAVGLCALGQRLENPLIRAFWDSARSAWQAQRGHESEEG